MRRTSMFWGQLSWFAVASVVGVLSGCSSEPSAPAGAGGSSGSGASGGSAGSAGATGGSAGSVQGGSAGSAAGSGGGGAGGGGAGGASAGGGGAGGTAGTGGGAGSSGAAGSAGAGGSGGGGTFALTSTNLTEGAEFADKYTCAAAGFSGSLSPALSWTAGPATTKSYAITFIDRTLADQEEPNGYHWVIYNIPASVLSLPEEFKDAAGIGAQQNSEYLGPCPNFGGGGSETHTYEFTVYALESETLTLSPTTGTGAVMDAETKLEADHLAKAMLSGTSDASPP